MPFSHIKAVVVSCVLGGVAFTGQALAVPALQLEDAASIVIPVVDEQEAVEQFLEPDEYPAGSQEESGPGQAPQAESGGGGDEIDALQEAFPSTNWPPSDREHKE
jgi:hypothetical protein